MPSEEEGAEPTALRIGEVDLTLLQQFREERLSEILRVWRAVAVTPDTAVKGIPVCLAQSSQGSVGIRGPGHLRGQDNAPVRGPENRRMIRLA